MRNNRVDLLLVVLMLVIGLVAGLATTLLAPASRAGAAIEHPSTFYTEGYGTRAAYLALADLGRPVRQLRRMIDPTTLAPYRGLVILNPVAAPGESELETLLAWVEAGNHLLIAPTRVQCEGGVCSYSDFTGWFQLANPGSADAGPPSSMAVEPDDRVGPLTGVKRVALRGTTRFSADSPLQGSLADYESSPLLADDEGLIALRVRVGEGAIYALADAYALTNAGLRESDSAVWLANLAWELSDGSDDAVIGFDEYHAGFPYRDHSGLAVARLLFEEGWGPAVAQTLVVAALALFAAGLRFGRARDIAPRKRRHHAEFILAAGRLLDAARGDGLAYGVLVAHYRAQLMRVLRLPAGAGDDELLAALRARRRTEFADWFAQAASRAEGSVRRRDLVAMAGRMHTELEAIEHAA